MATTAADPPQRLLVSIRRGSVRLNVPLTPGPSTFALIGEFPRSSDPGLLRNGPSHLVTLFSSTFFTLLGSRSDIVLQDKGFVQ